MTDTLLDAVHDLISPWTDVVDTKRPKHRYQPVEHEPLLVALRTAIRSSSGRTESGRSDDQARNVMNLQAFELWEQITTEVRTATRKHVRDTPNPLLGHAVRTLAERVDALWNQHQITEPDYLHLIRRAKAWRGAIWGLFNRLGEKELAHCPHCEQARIVNTDGEITAALVAYYRDGIEPYARCRHCGYTWVGEGQLYLLGKQLGATMDEEALTEMGVL